MHVPRLSTRRWRGVVACSRVSRACAQAVEFDEKIKAPMVMGGAELKSQAESYSATLRAPARRPRPRSMVTNQALFHERFDLEWQLKRALEDKRPLEDLSALGLVKHEDGFRIDYNAFPQWQPFPEMLASLMPTMNMDVAGPLLVARGFRGSDVAALRTISRRTI